MEKSDRVFADTNFFVGLFNAHDSLHGEARRLAGLIELKHRRLVLSNLVFLETVTVLSQRVSRDVAVAVGRYLREDPFLEIIHVGSFLHEEAWELFQKVPSKNVSFVDCSTVAVMKSECLSEILTFDQKDFRQLQAYGSFSFFQ